MLARANLHEPVPTQMPPDLNQLNGPQRKVVRDAFVAAFDAASLDILLQDMGRPPLANLVAQDKFVVMVFRLIVVATQEGWTEQLIAAAEQISGNPRIRILRQTLQATASMDVPSVDVQVNMRSPTSGGLERLVRADGAFADWGLWVARMSDIGGRICRIEFQAGVTMSGGTGFLVAPNLVLTNYHVLEKQESKLLNAADVRVRFDFAVGAQPSATVALASDWLVDSSSYSTHDPGDQGGPPDEDHLDYALIRLERAAGEELVNGAARGWIELSEGVSTPKPHSILFVGQHPKLEPLKLAVGAVIDANANSTRLRYDANTESGSSGSPCLDVGLNAVALHHAGDPDYSKLLGDFNQGIPIPLILKRLAKRGVPRFWV